MTHFCLFSLAECACKNGYLPRFDENSNIVECIEELTQGHCKDGQKYSWDLDSEEPMCLREDCSTIKDITKGCEQEGYLPYFDENGKQQCYEEFSQVTFKLFHTNVILFFGSWQVFFLSRFKVNSVQEAWAKCFTVHILKFEILQIT